MGELRIGYVFRRPRYPLLCVVGDVLIAARTRQQLQRRLGRCVLSPNETLSVIDASGEGWALHTDCMALSPMMMMKRWTKAELIELYQQTVAGALVSGFPVVAEAGRRECPRAWDPFRRREQ